MYPHQVLMEEQGLKRNDLSPEAQGYLTDFNHQYRGIDMKRARAEKAGKEFVLSPEDDAKLQRFSKSICVQIYQDFNTTAEKIKAEKEREEALKRETEELKKQQEQEEKERIEAIERKKQEEQEKMREQQMNERKKQEQAQQQQESGGNIFDYFF